MNLKNIAIIMDGNGRWAKKNNLQIDYFCSSPEKFSVKDKFDVILNMEIVEHVEDVNFF